MTTSAASGYSENPIFLINVRLKTSLNVLYREMLVFDNDQKGNNDQLKQFTETLNVIRRRHLDTVPRMATAVFKMTKINSSEGVNETVQYFLDRLYINR